MELPPQPGFDFHSWLNKTASKAASMSSTQKGAHWINAQKQILARTLSTLPYQLQKLATAYANEDGDRVYSIISCASCPWF